MSRQASPDVWLPKPPSPLFTPSIDRKVSPFPGSPSPNDRRELQQRQWLHTLEVWYMGVRNQGWRCILNEPKVVTPPTRHVLGMELFEKPRDESDNADLARLLTMLASHNGQRTMLRRWRRRIVDRRALALRTHLAMSECQRRALSRPWSVWCGVTMRRRAMAIAYGYLAIMAVQLWSARAKRLRRMRSRRAVADVSSKLEAARVRRALGSWRAKVLSSQCGSLERALAHSARVVESRRRRQGWSAWRVLVLSGRCAQSRQRRRLGLALGWWSCYVWYRRMPTLVEAHRR